MNNKNDRLGLLPLGALAAGFSIASAAMAQAVDTAPQEGEAVLPAVRAKAGAEPSGKNSLRATTTTIGKGQQPLRDIPQSVTVVTERLMDDRNLEEVKSVLRNTAGVSFVAGETGEEDVRLRGFSLQQAGDLYVDGLRDAPLYERDTFNFERIEVLKGSASMLFGRGSTGGVVNQVNKQPFLADQHEAEITVGSGDKKRVTGDFNWSIGDTAALRLNVMGEKTDNWGAKVEKHGIAPSLRWGIGTADEFTVSLYHLQYDNRPLYNHPWFISANNTIQPSLPANRYYGLASDHNEGSATYGTVTHVHRMDGGGELKTTLRHGRYERDLWASSIGFAPASSQPGGAAVTPATLSDATVLRRIAKGRVGTSDITTLQTDYSSSFDWLGRRHRILTGLELSHDDGKRNPNTPVGFVNPSPAPTTTVGTPDDGATNGEPTSPLLNHFKSSNVSAYVQDTVSLTQTFKVVAGLRFDHFNASYEAYSPLTANGSTTFRPVSAERSDNLWSPRLGLIYQPNDWTSYYASYGTSYNVSADTYQFAAGGIDINNKDINTAPEKSRNIEIGGKFDLLDNRLSLGTALFYSEKYNERNTDADTAATQQLLSGKRHAAGLELNLAGRLSPVWDAFVSYTWIPEAKIDESNVSAFNADGTPNNAQRAGDRSALTPKHSASMWSTYRVLPQLRLGAGLNFRGAQNPEGNRVVTAPAFTTFDAMAEYTINDNLTAKLYVLNLTDKLYADTLYRGFYAPGAPRTVQVSLKARF